MALPNPEPPTHWTRWPVHVEEGDPRPETPEGAPEVGQSAGPYTSGAYRPAAWRAAADEETVARGQRRSNLSTVAPRDAVALVLIVAGVATAAAGGFVFSVVLGLLVLGTSLFALGVILAVAE